MQSSESIWFGNTFSAGLLVDLFAETFGMVAVKLTRIFLSDIISDA